MRHFLRTPHSAISKAFVESAIGAKWKEKKHKYAMLTCSTSILIDCPEMAALKSIGEGEVEMIGEMGQ